MVVPKGKRIRPTRKAVAFYYSHQVQSWCSEKRHTVCNKLGKFLKPNDQEEILNLLKGKNGKYIKINGNQTALDFFSYTIELSRRQLNSNSNNLKLSCNLLFKCKVTMKTFQNIQGFKFTSLCHTHIQTLPMLYTFSFFNMKIGMYFH